MNATQSLDLSDITAIILSIILPGVGHMIIGQPLKGIVIFAAVMASCGVGYVISVLVAIDAYLVARTRKLRPVGPWELFPEYRPVGAY